MRTATSCCRAGRTWAFCPFQSWDPSPWCTPPTVPSPSLPPTQADLIQTVALRRRRRPRSAKWPPRSPAYSSALPLCLPAREPAESGPPPALSHLSSCSKLANPGLGGRLGMGGGPRRSHAPPPPPPPRRASTSPQPAALAGGPVPAVPWCAPQGYPTPTQGPTADPDFPADASFPQTIALSPGGLATGRRGQGETHGGARPAAPDGRRQFQQASELTYSGTTRRNPGRSQSALTCVHSPRTPSWWSLHVTLSRLPASFRARLPR